MIKSKTLFKVGTGLAAIVSAIAFTTSPTLASKSLRLKLLLMRELAEEPTSTQE